MHKGFMKTSLMTFALALLAVSCSDSFTEGLQKGKLAHRELQGYNLDYQIAMNRDFSHSDLKGFSARHAMLRGSVFTGADLQRADLRQADLAKADFTDSNVHLAFLWEANLAGANFTRSEFEGYSFHNMNLTGANFTQAKLTEVNLQGAKLQKTNFTESQIERVNFRFADLRKANFTRSNLRHLDLSFKDLKGADFTGADLTAVNFQGSNLKGAIFANAILRNTNLTNSNLASANFTGAKIQESKFLGSIMPNPDFSGAEIVEVTFHDFDMKGANFSQSNLVKVIFSQTGLTEANFTNAKLVKSQFKHSDLSESVMVGADLTSSRFYKTRFQKVDFQGMLFPRHKDKITGATLIQLPMGCYQMGDLFDENLGFEAAKHRVCIGDFFIGTHEVTGEQFAKVMGSNPSSFTEEANTPVENLSYGQIQDFLEKLSFQSGQKYRLPTEAEWEYACRELGSKVRFGHGQDQVSPDLVNFNAEKSMREQLSHIKDKKQRQQRMKNMFTFGMKWNRPTPVGIFQPNRLGLFDMSGNLAEMTADVWNPQAYANHTEYNPVETQGVGLDFRTIRGGHWNSGIGELRCAKRSFAKEEEPSSFVGFRLVMQGGEQ